MTERSVEDQVLLDTAIDVIGEALTLLRMITPEGWDRAWSLAAIDANFHTTDVGRIRDAYLLAVRGGGRLFRDDSYGRIYS